MPDADQRAYAGQLLRLMEGLAQEIIGTGFDPADPVIEGGESGEHDEFKSATSARPA